MLLLLTSIYSEGMDPLLDDGVRFANRCNRVGVPVIQKVREFLSSLLNFLQTYELLPHGFLNFALPNIPSAWKAKNEATAFLRKLFETAEEKKIW